MYKSESQYIKIALDDMLIQCLNIALPSNLNEIFQKECRQHQEIQK